MRNRPGKDMGHMAKVPLHAACKRRYDVVCNGVIVSHRRLLSALALAFVANCKLLVWSVSTLRASCLTNEHLQGVQNARK